MRAFWIAAGLVLAIAVLGVAAWSYWGPLDGAMFGGIVGGLIIAVATLALIWVGIEQLQGLTKTANADFFKRTDQFFRPETRTLLHLIEDGYLLFEEKKPFRDSYFLVDENKITGSGLHDDIKKTLLANKPVYSTYEIDDFILGPLEDLGSLEADERNLISFDLIYDFFSWYIRRTWGNEEIRRYVHGARTEREEAGDLYEHLRSLAERCEQRERSQTSGKPAPP
jgi:hypothetical protein